LELGGGGGFLDGLGGGVEQGCLTVSVVVTVMSTSFFFSAVVVTVTVLITVAVLTSSFFSVRVVVTVMGGGHFLDGLCLTVDLGGGGGLDLGGGGGGLDFGSPLTMRPSRAGTAFPWMRRTNAISETKNRSFIFQNLTGEGKSDGACV